MRCQPVKGHFFASPLQSGDFGYELGALVLPFRLVKYKALIPNSIP
jgi:hypothetical protein